MNGLKLQIPEGVRDYLPDECRNKRGLENALFRHFELAGYQAVETPLFEYYDVFSHGTGAIPQEKMIKFFDAKGHILVLSPDMTTPIARLAATRLRDDQGPMRISYVHPSFRNFTQEKGTQCQSSQAGIELLGERSALADAEVIALAISSLAAAGLEDIQIDIGQVDFFRGMMLEAGLDSQSSDQARHDVDQKNLLALEMLLSDKSLDGSLSEKIMMLPMLYGDRAVLDKAKRMSDHPVCRNALMNISKVCDILDEYGLNQYYSIDLGMLHSFNYYSGIIFRGMTRHLGRPLISGGRYDHLIEGFGRDMAATGFAVDVDCLLDALYQQGKAFEAHRLQFVVAADSSERAKAYSYVQQKRQEGHIAELYIGNMKQAKEYAEEKHACELVCFEKDHVFIVALQEDDCL